MVCRCKRDNNDWVEAVWRCAWCVVICTLYLQLRPISSPRHLRRGSGTRRGTLLGWYRCLRQTVTTSSWFLRTFLRHVLLDVFDAARLPSLRRLSTRRRSRQRLSPWNYQVYRPTPSHDLQTYIVVSYRLSPFICNRPTTESANCPNCSSQLRMQKFRLGEALTNPSPLPPSGPSLLPPPLPYSWAPQWVCAKRAGLLALQTISSWILPTLGGQVQVTRLHRMNR